MSTPYQKFGDVNTKFAQVTPELLSKQEKVAGKQLSTDDFVNTGTYDLLKARATSEFDVDAENIQNYGIPNQQEAEQGTASDKKNTALRNAQHFQRRYSYGTSAPDNSDGAPNGSVYFRYGTVKGTYVKAIGTYFLISNLGHYAYIKANGIWVPFMPSVKVGGEWQECMTDFTVTEFKNVGAGTWTVPADLNWISQILIVAGGGATGNNGRYNNAMTGGGGGGGVVHIQGYEITPGSSISYAVGKGGQNRYDNGDDSHFDGLTAKGGGGGGDSHSRNGRSGGSGGGGGTQSQNYGSGGTGTQTSQPGLSGEYGRGGNGASPSTWHRGGGGGGATGNGSTNQSGGAGFVFMNEEYGRGGRGQGTNNNFGDERDGEANKGEGASGGSVSNDVSLPHCKGGSGIIIIVHETV